MINLLSLEVSTKPDRIVDEAHELLCNQSAILKIDDLPEINLFNTDPIGSNIMTLELLKTLGQIAGIGGIALGIFLILYRDIIRKKIFPQLTKQQGFQLLILITVLVWSIALAGIGAWVSSNGRSEIVKGDNITQQVDQGGTAVIHTGEGDVNIEKSVAP